MSVTVFGDTSSIPSHASLTRAAGALAGVAAATLVWAVAVPMLGIHLLVRFGSSAPQTVEIGAVIGGSLLASLCGWALLALLERRMARARTAWTVISIGVLVVSFALPLSAGTTTSSRTVLVLIHVAVAAAVITILRRGVTSPARAGSHTITA